MTHDSDLALSLPIRRYGRSAWPSWLVEYRTTRWSSTLFVRAPAASALIYLFTSPPIGRSLYYVRLIAVFAVVWKHEHFQQSSRICIRFDRAVLIVFMSPHI